MSEENVSKEVFHPAMSGVKVTLKNAPLWKQFYKEGTEMIITKSGRRMFPSLRLGLSGLEDDTRYFVVLETALSDGHRYKFSTSEWSVVGTAEPQTHSSTRLYVHPDSPATGSSWMSQDVLFHRAKLTNNTLDRSGNLVLTSMHKYQPRIHIIRASDILALHWSPTVTFTFPETEFIAVTAYQNEKITKLKIDNNPFAKGFRENGQARTKRKLQSLEDRDEDIKKKHDRRLIVVDEDNNNDCHLVEEEESRVICVEERTAVKKNCDTTTTAHNGNNNSHDSDSGVSVGSMTPPLEDHHHHSNTNIIVAKHQPQEKQQRQHGNHLEHEQSPPTTRRTSSQAYHHLRNVGRAAAAAAAGGPTAATAVISISDVPQPTFYHPHTFWPITPPMLFHQAYHSPPGPAPPPPTLSSLPHPSTPSFHLLHSSTSFTTSAPAPVTTTATTTISTTYPLPPPHPSIASFPLTTSFPIPLVPPPLYTSYQHHHHRYTDTGLIDLSIRSSEYSRKH